jgi:predicted nucleotidyltransferase
MRLLEIQRQAIKTIVADIVGPESRVWLFGSRVDDTKLGGDIDLLIETDTALANRVAVLCQLEGRFAKVLGDRKIDVLLKDARTAQELPIYQAAKAKGTPL